MHLRADATAAECLHHGSARRAEAVEVDRDREQVIRARATGDFRRGGNRVGGKHAGELRAISSRELAASCDERAEAIELRETERALQVAEPIVPAELLDLVAPRLI